MHRPSSLPRARPVAPFEDWPTQVYDPCFGFVWYTRPAILVSQLTLEQADIAAAAFLQDHIDLVLAHRADEIRAEGGLFNLHDFRSAAGIDTDARVAFVERMRKRPHGYLRRSVTCVRTSPLIGMVVQAVNLVATLVSGGKTELASDPREAVTRWGIEPPRASERFPGK